MYIGSEMEEFIKESLPKDIEGYFFKCNVSKYNIFWRNY